MLSGIADLDAIEKAYSTLGKLGFKFSRTEKVSFLGFFIPKVFGAYDLKSRTRESYAMMKVEHAHVNEECILPAPVGTAGLSDLRRRMIAYVRKNNDKFYTESIAEFDEMDNKSKL